MILFPGPLQFSKVMGIAQCMGTVVLIVRLPVIMAHPPEERQNTGLIGMQAQGSGQFGFCPPFKRCQPVMGLLVPELSAAAGKRSFSCLRWALTALIAASTSMFSIFTYPHPTHLECVQYRTGFQYRILVPDSKPETIKNTT